MSNKKSQAAIVGIMCAVVIFIALCQLISPLQIVITQARSDMSCGTPGLSTGTAASCVIVDWFLPYFLAAGIAVSIGYVTQRKVVEVQS